MTNSIKARLLTTSIMIIAAYSTTATATPVLDGSKVSSNSGVLGVFQNGLATNVYQNAANARLNWTSIDTNSNESLNFYQPTRKSVIINDVTSGQVTSFLGKMTGNGIVVVKNDAGVIFGAGSQVNVGALVVTTAKTVTGNTFANFSDNAVQLNGTISAPGGYVNALAKEVDVGNTGAITTDAGKVNLSAGSKSYVVDLKGDGKVTYSVANLDSGKITVLGNVQAHSGSVIIQAKATDIASGVINLSGVVDTSSLIKPGAAAIPGSLSITGSGAVNMAGSAKSGAINVTSGGSLNMNSALTSSGNVDLNSGGMLTSTAAIDTSSDKIAGGSITLASASDMALSGDLISGSKAAAGGNIIIKSKGATNIDGAIYTVSTINNGGHVTITSGKDLEMSNHVNTLGVLNGGSLSITSGGKFTLGGDINTTTYGRAGGNITITAKDDALINKSISASNTSSQASIGPGANGGNITITSDKDLTVNNTVLTHGLRGGNIVLTAKSAYTSGGAAEYATSGTTGGSVIIKGGTGSSFGDYDTKTGINNIFKQIDTSSSGTAKDGVETVTGPNGKLVN